jgi:hypothetical protein
MHGNQHYRSAFKANKLERDSIATSSKSAQSQGDFRQYHLSDRVREREVSCVPFAPIQSFVSRTSTSCELKSSGCKARGGDRSQGIEEQSNSGLQYNGVRSEYLS